MTNADKVSIIIPVFNTEKYLRRCVNSVCNQSYSNIEIILINDGSTDGCNSICNDYVSKDPRVAVIHQDNQGQSEARNKGLSLAKGEYITFIDSDDFVSSVYIEALLNLCEQNNSDIAQCGFQTGNLTKFKRSSGRHKICIYNNRSALLSKDLKIAPFWGKLYARHLFNGIKFPSVRIYEDEYTVYKLVYASKFVTVTDQKLYYYFKSPGSIMRNNKNQLSIDFIDAYNERIEFFQNKKEQLLYEAAHRRLCIELILFYSKCLNLRSNANDLPSLMDIFRLHYDKVVDFKSTPFKDLLIFRAFVRSPRFIGTLISTVKK